MKHLGLHQRNAGSIPVARSFSSRSALFVCGSLLTFMEPRYIFVYYAASFYKYAWSSEFWIEHTNIGRKCYQKSTKICYSIVFECCLTHGFAVSRRRAFAVRESRS
jgi:hypothetical protein